MCRRGHDLLIMTSSTHLSMTKVKVETHPVCYQANNETAAT